MKDNKRTQNKTSIIITICTCKYVYVDRDEREFAKKKWNRSIRLVGSGWEFFLKIIFNVLRIFV